MATRKKVSRNRPFASKRKIGGKSSNRRPDAIALLKADHATVNQLFDQFEKARNSTQKSKVAQKICRELTVHTTIEEELFYPAVRQASEEAELLDEAEVEHASAKDLIEQIESGGPDDELWDAKVKVLGEYVRHHVKEEESELFPEVRRTDLDLLELAQRLAERKQELLATQ